MCDDEGEMMADREQKRLEDVEAPCAPTPLSAYEIVTLRRLVQSGRRRALKRVRQNAAAGRTVKSGADADAVRAELLARLDEKIGDWLEEAWPLVRDAGVVGVVPPGADDEAREQWLAESSLEGARVARLAS